MRSSCRVSWVSGVVAAAIVSCCGAGPRGEPPASGLGSAAAVDAAHEARMAWWREAKFGMFIHWGLYAIPAGEWPGKGSTHGEWIRDTAQIPVGEYEKLLGQFNPVRFNADEWVKLAQDAGVRYLVITSKHHDGFCLFDSAQTDWDVMSTPFKRDIMKELSDACKKTEPAAGDRLRPGERPSTSPVRFCMYHSIMDWHHPDYLPRRPWEKADRSATGADFERFVGYLKNQLAEIAAPKYDPGVIWFDGEWEGTWTHERGEDLFAYMRKIAPNVIVNNRIDKGRAGMEGVTKGPGFLGDYQTPEQTIPERTIPGDWETCMTMNGNWGYNAADKNFKSTEDLVKKLCDIASKGGNFLLNVGPTAEGEIPPESVQRLREIGAWMRMNGESIYGTVASPLAEQPAWGRVTMKRQNTGMTRLFLQVFDRPASGEVFVPGLLNKPMGVSAVGVRGDLVVPPSAEGRSDGVLVKLGSVGAGGAGMGGVSVVALDIAGEPDVAVMPVISAEESLFVDSIEVTATSSQKNVTVRYTTDGTEPGAGAPAAAGPITLTQSATVKARAFRGDRPVTAVTQATYSKVSPKHAVQTLRIAPGLAYDEFHGAWSAVPDFASMTPAASGIAETMTLKVAKADDQFGLRFTGFIEVPRDGVYRFSLASDDGSNLYIGNELVVGNDGLHSLSERHGSIALQRGLHPIRVEFFERTGGAELVVSVRGPGISKREVPAGMLKH